MPTSPHCPRCDYDLQGQLATWHPNGPTADNAHCPTQGLCSECGLTFEWCYLLRPELIELRWFVETPRPPRAKRTYWRTWWHALRPWHFWQQVRMETTFSRPRLLGWPCMIALHCFTFALISILALTLFRSFSLNMFRQSPGYLAQTLLADFGHSAGEVVQLLAIIIWPRTGLAWTNVFIAGSIVPPLMFLGLPFTRAQSKVQRRHVLRAAIYALAPLPALTCIGLVVLILSQLTNIFGYYTATQWLGKLQPFFGDTYVSWAWSHRESQSLWLLLICWFPLWWACAFKIGFRMQDWKPALAAVTIPTLIVQLVFIHMNIDFNMLRLF